MPLVALVFGDPERARCAAEGEGVAGAVYCQAVAVDEVIGMLLGQTVAQEPQPWHMSSSTVIFSLISSWVRAP